MNFSLPNMINVLAISVLVAVSLLSCHSSNTQSAETEEDSLTPYQESLVEEGWYIPKTLPEGELPKNYGVKSIYGQQDNYFDIEIGNGCSVAIKIVNVQNGQCIRYVVVPENTSITVNQIPQGKYQLKLAYGKDWMEFDEGNGAISGKFTDGAVYEKSIDTFDFGLKNSDQMVNYQLKINIVDDELMNNFTTTEISEDEFLN